MCWFFPSSYGRFMETGAVCGAFIGNISFLSGYKSVRKDFLNYSNIINSNFTTTNLLLM